MSPIIQVSLDKLKQQAASSLAHGDWWKSQKYPQKETLNKCIGSSVDQLTCCAEESQKIHEAMGILIDNTVAFCKSVQVNFEKADQA